MDFSLLIAQQSANGLLVEGILIILTTGLLASFVCRQWSLPSLMGYIVVGMAIGPSALGLVRAQVTEIEHVAELGVFFLLFSIGLELSLEELRRTARYLLVGGPVQMLLVALPVAMFLMHWGWQPAKAWLFGAVFSFSSTVLVFKALGEMGVVTAAAGRRSIAILLFQDAALVPLLLCLPMLASADGEAGESGWIVILDWLDTALVSLGFLAGTVLLRIIMVSLAVPRIMKHRSPDLVVLLALVVLGTVTLTAHRIGLPSAIGALAAGVVFGGNRWAEQIDSLILPFREVFAAVFFVSLGLLIDPIAVAQAPLVIAGLLAGLIAVKSFSALIALWSTGLPLRQCFGPSLALAHVGEFAFVLLLLSSKEGIVSESERQVAVSVAGGSILLAPMLIRWGFQNTPRESNSSQVPAISGVARSDQLRRAVIIGMGPVGRATASQLETLGYELSCLDLNPLNLQTFAHIGVETVAGNAESDDVLTASRVPYAKLIVVCVPQDEVAVRVTQHCRKLNTKTKIVVRCRYLATVSLLRQAGADYILSEEANAASQLVSLIAKL